MLLCLLAVNSIGIYKTKNLQEFLEVGENKQLLIIIVRFLRSLLDFLILKASNR